MSLRLKNLIILAALFIGIGIIWKIFVAIYPDWLWFSEAVNYPAVFKTILFTKILMGVICALFLLVVVLGNLYIIKKIAPPSFRSNIMQALPIGGEIDFDIRKYLYIILAVVLGGLCIVMGYGITARWEVLLRYMKSGGVTFGTIDPIFSKDISFYVFKMPFLRDIYGWMFGLFLLLTFFTGAMYFFHGAIISDRNKFEPPLKVKAHLFSLIGLTLLFKAWGYTFTMYDLLYSQRGVVFGAGYADVNARLPVLWILLFLCIISAVVFFASIFVRKIRYAAGIFILLIFVGMIGRVYPSIIQQFKVTPSELDLEKPYIVRNVDFTRKAYNLDEETVEEKVYELKGELTLDNVTQNVPVMDNIRLWDWRPLRRIYRDREKLRLQYEFKDVDIDRYKINDQIKQVMLAARELNFDNLQENHKTWVNRTFLYTHGYGVAMSPVKEILKDGNPQMYIGKIPIEYSPDWPEDLKLNDEPGARIYYGELTNYYAIVNPEDVEKREFDFPTIGEVEDYEKYTYNGKGGVGISSLIRKLVYSWKFKSYNILLSDYVTKGSRILYDRKILERANRVAPFLKYDSDPYLVLSEGRLYWILDAYTTTHLYPYSERMEDVSREIVAARRGRRASRRVIRRGEPWGNYIRNSVKVVIDAYDGKMDYYIMEDDNYPLAHPIARCYQKIFPQLFKSSKEMPLDLQKHLRYPVAMFMIQALKYQDYHMKRPDTFYLKEDVWRIGEEMYDNTDRVRATSTPEPTGGLGRFQPQRVSTTTAGNVQPVEPYYVVLTLLEGNPEFLLILPYTPANNKKILGAWMAARCDVESGEYGKLFLFRFPKGAKSIPSPMQIEELISNEAKITEQLTLWDQAGSRVLRGNLLVIPMNDALLYIEPLYIQADLREPIPKLSQVIVGYGTDVVMGENLDDALMQMFGGAQPIAERTEETTEPPERVESPELTTSSSVTIKSLAESARKQYKEAQAAQRAGRWAEYGETLKKLEKNLKLLEEKAGNL